MIVERIMKPGSEAKVFLRRAFEEANRYREIGYYALLKGKVKGITVRKGQDFEAIKRMSNYLREFSGERKYLTARSLPFLASQILKRYQCGLPYIEQEKSFLFYPTAKTFKKENRIWLPIYQKHVKLLPLAEDDPITAFFLENQNLRTTTITCRANDDFRVHVVTGKRKDNTNAEEG